MKVPAIKKFCQYIEAHHEEFGVALFVLPPMVAVFAVAAVIKGLCFLLQ